MKSLTSQVGADIATMIKEAKTGPNVIEITEDDHCFLHDNPRFAVVTYLTALSRYGVKLGRLVTLEEIKSIFDEREMKYFWKLSAKLKNEKISVEDLLYMLESLPEYFLPILTNQVIQDEYTLSDKQLANIIAASLNARPLAKQVIQRTARRILSKCKDEHPVIIYDLVVFGTKPGADMNFQLSNDVFEILMAHCDKSEGVLEFLTSQKLSSLQQEKLLKRVLMVKVEGCNLERILQTLDPHSIMQVASRIFLDFSLNGECREEYDAQMAVKMCEFKNANVSRFTKTVSGFLAAMHKGLEVGFFSEQKFIRAITRVTAFRGLDWYDIFEEDNSKVDPESWKVILSLDSKEDELKTIIAEYFMIKGYLPGICLFSACTDEQIELFKTQYPDEYELHGERIIRK